MELDNRGSRKEVHFCKCFVLENIEKWLFPYLSVVVFTGLAGRGDNDNVVVAMTTRKNTARSWQDGIHLQEHNENGDLWLDDIQQLSSINSN